MKTNLLQAVCREFSPFPRAQDAPTELEKAAEDGMVLLPERRGRGRRGAPLSEEEKMKEGFRITLLGTAHGNPTFCRFNTSTLVECGGEGMLIDAGTHELLYYKHHRISARNWAGFLPKDIKVIFAKR